MENFLFSFLSLVRMLIELLAAEFIFGSLLKKRKQFYMRVFISIIIALSLLFLIEIIYYEINGEIFAYSGSTTPTNSIFKFFLYCFIFIMSILIMFFSYQEPWQLILFYGAGGFASQHLSSNLAFLFYFIPNYELFVKDYRYLSYLVELGVCAIVYTLVYLIFVRGKICQPNNDQTRNKTIFSFFVILILIGLSRITLDNPSRNSISFIAETISAIVNCLFILSLHFSFTENEKMHNEIDVLNELLRREKEQYKMSKENIDLINMKCHDLKHQINALRNDAAPDRLAELEKSVDIYDSQYKTGNEVLDVILTEKSLYCLKNKIKLQCLANGKDLAFMDSMDIYSLFGNALSNAIESVSNVDEKHRVISLNINTVNDMLSVHMDNYFAGQLKFENGFPVTQKDKGYHGFGLKSMNYITNKYNGNMSITADKNIFSLDIIFPIKKTK